MVAINAIFLDSPLRQELSGTVWIQGKKLTYFIPES